MRFSDGLAQRHEAFSVDVPQGADFREWLATRLLESPALAASLSGLSATLLSGPFGSSAQVSASYSPVFGDGPAFLVHDSFELACAVSLSLRKHLPVAKVVADNASGFTSARGMIEQLRGFREHVGEDLGMSQSSGALSHSAAMCDGRVVACTTEMSYFESPETFNALTVAIAEHAEAARSKMGADGHALANEFARWMRENVSYRDTGDIADHSAAGLLRNGTAVCQGIAAYSSQFLWSCGIENRYVHGLMDGGRHAWNVAKVNGRWVHLDYTAALSWPKSIDIADAPRKLFAKGRQWDRSEYSDRRNEEVCRVRTTLAGSRFAAIPEAACYSVNGCIVDTTESNPFCLVRDGIVLVSVGDLAQDLGGGWRLDAGKLRLALPYGLEDVSRTDIRIVHGLPYMPAAALPSLGLSVAVSDEQVRISPRKV